MRVNVCCFLVTALLAVVAQAAPTVAGATGPQPPQADVKLTYGGTAGVQYRSNIYREQSNESDDFITVVNPGFAVRSKKDVTDFTVKGGLKAGHYLDKDDNDFVDGGVNGTADIGLGGDALVQVHGAWRRDHVEVGGFSTDLSEPDRRASEPTVYYTGDVGADVQTPVGDDWQARAGAKAVYFDYQNQDDTNGRRIIQDDRDRYELIGTAQLGYVVRPHVMPFVAGDLNRRTYRTQVDASARYGRDSTGGGIYGGLQLNNPELDPDYLAARVGWLMQDYDNGFLPDVDTFGFDGQAAYRFNEKNRMEATAARSAVENSLLGASGAVQTTASATFYHSLTTQWNADLLGRYSEYDFSINPASGRTNRDDHLYESVLGVTYDIAAPLYLRGEYEFAHRTSDEQRARYTDNGVMMLVGMKY